MKNLSKALFCALMTLAFFGCEKPQETKQDNKMQKNNKKSLVSQQIEEQLPAEKIESAE